MPPRAKVQKKPVIDPTKLAAVDEMELGYYAEMALRAYGTEVNEERSIPALSDGLKVVTRRLIWTSSRIAKEYTKAARIVGDTLGRLHPHSDIGTYGGLVTLATCAVPPVEGRGNWGNLVNGAAAMRYPEARLSVYGRHFVSPNYLAVTPMTPNYDDKDTEPVYLPALLPNILFNFQSGIGYGLQTNIPGFTPESVLPLLCRILDKETITPIEYAKALKFNLPWGGEFVKTKTNRDALVQLMTQPNASIAFLSPLEIDQVKKTVTIRKFAPELNLETFKEKLQGVLRSLKPTSRMLAESKYWKSTVQHVGNDKGLSFVIQIRKTLNVNEFNAAVEKIKALASTKVSFNINVSDRKPLGDNKYEVSFKSLSVPQLMMAWLKFRIRLETDSLKWQIGETEKHIDYLKLLIHACDHLDIIFAALRKPNTAELIAKGLKISLDQANQILELKVRQLSKLDQDVLKEKLRDTVKKLAILNARLKAPAKSVRSYLEQSIEKFSVQAGRPNGQRMQWWLD